MQRFIYLSLAAIFSILSILLIAACSAPTSTPTTEPATILPTTANPTAAVQPTTVPIRSPATTQPATKAPNTATTTSVPPSATVPPTTEPSAAAANKTFSLDIEPIATDLRRPIFVTDAGDDSGRLFLVEQPGRILILENGRVNPTPFLDVADKLTTNGNEQGLLGLAFHPDYKNNGLFFINYSAVGTGDNIVARYRVSEDPNVANADSEQVILKIPGAEPNHNGGVLAFGPDGYLYIGTGDGGGAGDRHGTIGNGQALNTLLGKILRIDVNADTYTVPDDNPFANTADALPEIWSYGWRNPWRMSFDHATGDLYVGDVGQSNVEEISFQPAGEGGGNYGWRIMEGNDCYDDSANCGSPDLIAPIATYSHDLGCAVTGGYVYRGQKFPWLVGQYIFADYCTGIVWVTARDTNGEWQTRQVTTFDDTISSFGQDQAGELYVVGHREGTIYKLTSTE